MNIETRGQFGILKAGLTFGADTNASAIAAPAAGAGHIVVDYAHAYFSTGGTLRLNTAAGDYGPTLAAGTGYTDASDVTVQAGAALAVRYTSTGVGVLYIEYHLEGGTFTPPG